MPCDFQKSATDLAHVFLYVWVHVTGLEKFMLSHVTWSPHDQIK